MKCNKLCLASLLLFIFIGGCNKSDNPAGPGSSVWTQCQGLPNNLPVTGFAASGNNLVAGSYNAPLSQAYIFISFDNGSSWSLDTTFRTYNHDTTTGTGPHPAPLFVGTPVTFFSDGGYLFAGIVEDGGHVYISTDNGKTWVERDTNFVESVNCFTAIGETIFAGGDGVFLSTNHGASWVPATTGLSGAVSGLATIGTSIFACTEGEGIYRSTNGGASWDVVNMSLFDFHSLSTVGTDIFAGFPGGYSNGGVLKSTDNGTSWSTAGVGLIDSSVNVLYASGSDLFAGTNEDVFLSANSGGSWMDISAGTQIDSLGVGALTVYDSYLLVATSAGVWRAYFH